MTIKIVVDSACDLPEELARQYGISIIPLFIQVGDETYRDGIDMSRQEFFQRLPGWNQSPTTAAPGPEVFRREYERLALEGATQILSIHLSVNLSTVIESARLAAADTTIIPVAVLDSQQLSLGAGLLAITAVQAATKGCSMPEILAILNDQIDRTHVFAALDTLEYLKRSGRMSHILSLIGNLLQIKPLLRMYKGKATSEKVRTRRKAIERLLSILKSLDPFEKVALLHSNTADRAEAVFQLAKPYLPKTEIIRAEISPVLGAHIGPGVIGFVCITCPK